jgi:choline dehydrogenase-like flavoprotein
MTMSAATVKYDAIVIGSGAAGGMAAKCLTDGGASVLVLEAGPEWPATRWREQKLTPQAFAAQKRRQPIQSQSLSYNNRNCHLFIDDIENPYSVGANDNFIWIRSRLAGGRTLLWSRFALRMSAEEFTNTEQDGFGASWPITYEEIAPYYDRAETLLGVYGTRENLPALPDGSFLSAPTPSFLTELRRRIESRFPERHLIRAREVAEDTGITDSNPPSHSSIGSTLMRCDSAKLSFRSNSVVARVELDRADHASGVLFIDRETGQWRNATARAILCCASTIETVRLLLASATREFTAGLANTSGTLGHYLMDHFAGCRLIARGKLAEQPAASRARGYIPRFCNMGRERENFLRGYGFQTDFEIDRRGSVLLSLGVFGEVLPYYENFIALDAEKQDSCGLAVPKIHFRYRDNEHLMALHSQTSARELVEAMGLAPIVIHDTLLPPGTRAHELGGARMGSNPENSVLNRWNQCWDVSNLFITDGSCFPSAGYQGPTLTIMALTARTCDHILSRLRSGQL